MTILDRALGRPRTISPVPGGSRAGARRGLPAWEQWLRLRPALIVVGAAVVVIGLVQIVQTSDATSTSFSIQRLDQERLDWQTRVQQLEAQVAALSSLNRVEQEARGRLGMVPAAARESVQVNLPAPEQPLLGGDRAAHAGAEGDKDASSWWQELLKLLPFH